MDAGEEMRMAELLCSRLCHDLVNPVGAINNGVELIEETGQVGEEVLRLIAGSGRQAAARLQFFRLAFGYAGTQATPPVDEVRALAAGLLDGGKVRLDWPEASADRAPAVPGWAKLLLNLVALAAEALPRGGAVSVRLEPQGTGIRFAAKAAGQGARLSEAVKDALDLAGAAGALDARSVQPRFAALIAQRMGSRIEAREGDGWAEFAVALPAAG